MTLKFTVPAIVIELEFPGGKTLSLDTTQAIEDFDKLFVPGEKRLSLFRKVVAHVFATYGVDLSLGEAEWLWENLGNLHAKKKQSWQAAFEPTAESHGSSG